jgi:hypothetical protein
MPQKVGNLKQFNFFQSKVQPYKDTTELERLMASMRDFYGDEKKRITLTNDNLSKDIYFAALHTDGSWYRVKINSQLDSW